MTSGIKNIEINPEWLYHQINFLTIDEIILSGGLKSNQLRKEKVSATGWNGNHYISLARYDTRIDSAYNHYIKEDYAFIIHDVESIKTRYKDNHYDFWCMIASLPISRRYSSWKNEYQVKDIVPLDKVVGIKLPNRNSVKYSNRYDEDNPMAIDCFLDKLDLVQISFPFIDIKEQKMIEKDKVKAYILGR